MGDQIVITPEEVHGKANEYRTQAATFDSVIKQMDSLQAFLSDTFKGKASRQFAERYSELKPGFEQTRALIDEIAQALDAVATRFDKVDVDIASLL